MDFAAASMDVEPRKVGVLFTILIVSLFAVSFPTVSKVLPFLRIPTVVFFIGKHFGTGVILATAFIHLLDDAFRSLQGPEVERRYPGLGKWTGAIILASLLSIFLIEYISTSYVEQLHDKPSAPPSPVVSAPASRAPSPSTKIPPPVVVTESTPLIPAINPLRRHATDTHLFRHHLPVKFPGVPVQVLHNSPRICRLTITKDRVRGRDEYGVDVGYNPRNQEEERSQPRIGRRRQIIGILVLQLGIMIHSFVIGMTLAITTGSDFTSLTTAVIFHQLFEGLSLGIRIAALPEASSKEENEETAAESTIYERAAAEVLGESASDVEVGGSTPSRKRRIRRRWCDLRGHLTDVHWFKPTLSFLFGVTTPAGMGLGLLLWNKKTSAGDEARMFMVQGIMSAVSAGMLIYAATVEMLAGDFVFGDVEGGTHHHHHHGGDKDEDEDQYDHEHEHEHDHDEEQEPDRGRAVSPCAANGRAAKRKMVVAASEPGEEQGGDGGKKASMGKRVLAVLSLLAGVGMMVAIGLGE